MYMESLEGDSCFWSALQNSHNSIHTHLKAWTSSNILTTTWVLKHVYWLTTKLSQLSNEKASSGRFLKLSMKNSLLQTNCNEKYCIGKQIQKHTLQWKCRQSQNTQVLVNISDWQKSKVLSWVWIVQSDVHIAEMQWKELTAKLDKCFAAKTIPAQIKISTMMAQ